MDIISKDELVNKVGDLKVLPFVARKVLDIIGNENVAIGDLITIIEKDQTIAARILKISNSALYGLRQEVTSLQQALMILGFKTIRSLVLSASTKSLYKKFGITEKMMWDHSVGVAIAAKIVSKGLGADVSEAAFIGGLMHDLGKVIMNNETPDAFSQVIMKVYNDGIDSIAAEEEIYGYNHTEIGSKVIAKWGLSPSLIKILQYHHLNVCGIEDIGDPLAANGVACVHLADCICKLLGIGYREPDDSIILSELPSAKYLGISKEKTEQLVRECSETYEKEKSVFE